MRYLADCHGGKSLYRALAAGSLLLSTCQRVDFPFLDAAYTATSNRLHCHPAAGKTARLELCWQLSISKIPRQLSHVLSQLACTPYLAQHLQPTSGRKPQTREMRGKLVPTSLHELHLWCFVALWMELSCICTPKRAEIQAGCCPGGSSDEQGVYLQAAACT